MLLTISSKCFLVIAMSFSCVKLLPASRVNIRNWWIENIGSLLKNDFIEYMTIRSRPSPLECDNLPDGSLMSMVVVGYIQRTQYHAVAVQCRRLTTTDQLYYHIVMAISSTCRYSQVDALLRHDESWQTIDHVKPAPILFGIVEIHGESCRPRPVYPKLILDIVAAVDDQLPTKEISFTHYQSQLHIPGDAVHKEVCHPSRVMERSNSNPAQNVFDIIEQRMQWSGPRETERLSRITLEKLESWWWRYDGSNVDESDQKSIFETVNRVFRELICWEEYHRVEYRLQTLRTKQLLLERSFMKFLNGLIDDSSYSTDVDHQKVVKGWVDKFSILCREGMDLLNNRHALEFLVKDAIYCISPNRSLKIQRIADIMIIRLSNFPSAYFANILVAQEFMLVKAVIVHATEETLERHLDTFLSSIDIGPTKTKILIEIVQRRQSPSFN